MSKPTHTCAYCNDKGWSKKWAEKGYRVGGYSALGSLDPDRYQCPYCNKPENSEPAPDWMFTTKK